MPKGTPKKPRAEVSQDRKAKFVAALSATGSIKAACEVANLNRPLAYRHKGLDSAFSAAWDEAMAMAMDAAEDELYRRAVTGWEEPVFYKGELKNTIVKYSDGLLKFLLQAHRPEKYRFRKEAEVDPDLDAWDADTQ